MRVIKKIELDDLTIRMCTRRAYKHSHKPYKPYKPFVSKMLGAIAAYLIGLKRFAPNDDLLMTMVEWQGGPAKSWIPYYKPIMTDYSHFNCHISNEIILFLLALVAGIWAWRNRNHKEEGIFARVVLGLSLAAAVYIPLLWLARHHVEGDWTAVPPALSRTEVDTPEFLAEQAARDEYFKQERYKRLGLTPTGEKIWHKVCIYY